MHVVSKMVESYVEGFHSLKTAVKSHARKDGLLITVRMRNLLIQPVKLTCLIAKTRVESHVE
jgi:hypothetical protein